MTQQTFQETLFTFTTWDKLVYLLLFLKEKETGIGAGRERIPSRLHIFRKETKAGLSLMNRGLISQTVRSWPEPKSSQMLNRLSHPNARKLIYFLFLPLFYVGFMYPTESLLHNLLMDLNLQFEKYYFTAYPWPLSFSLESSSKSGISRISHKKESSQY